MKQLLKNLYGLLVTIINNHDKRITEMELKFPELASYVAKTMVTIGEVKDLVTKEVAAANAESATAIAALSADLLAKAKTYTDDVDGINDSTMAEVVAYLGTVGVKLNVIGGIIGTPIPPVTDVPPVVEAPAPVTDAPPVDVPVETPPADPTATPI